jgi:hypothetical protein
VSEAALDPVVVPKELIGEIEPARTDSLKKSSGDGAKQPSGEKPPTSSSKKVTSLNDRVLKSSDPSKKKTTDSVNFNDRAEMKASDPLTIGSKLKKGSNNSGSQLNDRVSAGPESTPPNKYGIVEF